MAKTSCKVCAVVQLLSFYQQITVTILLKLLVSAVGFLTDGLHFLRPPCLPRGDGMYLAVTGHRPDRLGGYGVQPRLDHFALGVLARVGASRVYTGMAQGWDQAIAAACVALDIPFVAVLPGFATGGSQSSRWPAPARERYDRLLAAADAIERLPFPGAGREFHMRDQRIAEAGSLLLALWDGDARSGTGMTIRMARVPVVNVWKEWICQ